jgi:hypothetical protein
MSTLLSLPSNGSSKFIPLFVARKRLRKHLTAALYTRYNRGIVGRVIVYAVRSVSKKLGD